MSEPQPFDPPPDGSHLPLPITRVLALGYYDGPTNGVLQCGPDGPVYKFDLLDGPFCTEDSTEDLRIFRLAPLPPTALTQLSEAYERFWPPRWPVWVPVWHFPTPEEQKATEQFTEAILQQAGPVEWVIAAITMPGEVHAARPVTEAELAKVTDWLSFLGLAAEDAVKQYKNLRIARS